jgi:hypothetical protein
LVEAQTTNLTCDDRYIQEGRQHCSALKRANYELSERFVRLENNWVRFGSQLNFFQRIQHVMEDEHREVYSQTLQVLQNKLEIVVSLLRGLVTQQPRAENGASSSVHKVRRWRYASSKETLDEAIVDLETWQGLADQSWYLLLRIADSQVDTALTTSDNNTEPSTGTSLPETITIRAGIKQVDTASPKTSPASHINLSPSALKGMSITPIPYSSAITIATKTHSDGSTGRYILNQIPCAPGSIPQLLKRDVRDLVRKLQVDSPHTFGLLKCKGFIVESDPAAHFSLRLVFRDPPASHSPRSLRDLLLSMPRTTSNTRRLEIAQCLARSVGYVHTFGFVHKNVCPESVLVFERAGELGIAAFLVGFEHFRRDEGWTQRRGDDALHKNLYRHVSRQGFKPQDDYEIRHDIYSLGVCLLEIGLWESFVKWEVETGARSLAKLLMDSAGSSQLPEQAKDTFLALARDLLPGRIGDRYAEIVETCLTCLDPDNVDFGDEKEFEDADGVRVGARYIEKVSRSTGGCWTLAE